MGNNKREKILDSALTLFAQRGYDAVSVDELASSVGIKGPALYYYFQSKEDLLNKLIDRIQTYYKEAMETLTKEPETLEDLISISLQQADFLLHDSRMQKIRKLLSLEQFRTEQLRSLCTQHSLTNAENTSKQLLSTLQQKGLIVNMNTDLLAFEFSAPISVMLHWVDREPNHEAEALHRIQQHLQLFVEVYRVKG